jgi:5-methylcytosine-specific restriction endonuclease McrA
VSTKVLVLNQDYQAISICSPERAFVLVYLGKAEQLHSYTSLALRTVNRSFHHPSVIRLLRYVHLPFRKVALSRANIFRRDGHKCAYCGSRQNLTIDHVVPRSQGGKDTWDNLVTACQVCNTKKGDRTPEQAEMPLYRDPFRPSFIMFLHNYSGRPDEDWMPYLMMK